MHRTLGELVRDAVTTAYSGDAIDRRRSVAIAAYQEELVSLGRLAEPLGLDPISARAYCSDRDIPQMTQDAAELLADASHA